MMIRLTPEIKSQMVLLLSKGHNTREEKDTIARWSNTYLGGKTIGTGCDKCIDEAKQKLKKFIALK